MHSGVPNQLIPSTVEAINKILAIQAAAPQGAAPQIIGRTLVEKRRLMTCRASDAVFHNLPQNQTSDFIGLFWVGGIFKGDIADCRYELSHGGMDRCADFRERVRVQRAYGSPCERLMND